MSNVEPLLTERNLDIPNGRGTLEEVAPANDQPLRDNVERAVTSYFEHLEGQDVTDVYDMVMAEVEAPLLEVVMKYTRHNQTKAATVLGLNRGTLRKKLKRYGLL